MSAADGPTGAEGNGERSPVTTLSTPMRLEYLFSAGIAQSKNLRGLAAGKFIGQRCPV